VPTDPAPPPHKGGHGLWDRIWSWVNPTD